jgi:hypothetical protein
VCCFKCWKPPKNIPNIMQIDGCHLNSNISRSTRSFPYRSEMKVLRVVQLFDCMSAYNGNIFLKTAYRHSTHIHNSHCNYGWIGRLMVNVVQKISIFSFLCGLSSEKRCLKFKLGTLSLSALNVVFSSYHNKFYSLWINSYTYACVINK